MYNIFRTFQKKTVFCFVDFSPFYDFSVKFLIFANSYKGMHVTVSKTCQKDAPQRVDIAFKKVCAAMYHGCDKITEKTI